MRGAFHRGLILLVVLAGVGCGSAAPPSAPTTSGKATPKPAASATAPAATAPAGTVATIDGVAITEAELALRLDPASLVAIEEIENESERAYKTAELRARTLATIIDDRLIVAAAVATKIEVFDDQVESTLVEIQTQNHMTREQLVKVLADQGYTLESYRKDLRDQLLRLAYISRESRPGEAREATVARITAQLRARAKIAVFIAVPPKPASLGQLLDVSKLLTKTDLDKTLGRTVPAVDVSRLQSDDRSQTYDSLHLQAVGKAESFDIAIRVWRGASAERMYAELVDALPNVGPGQPVGTESFQAQQPDIHINGYGFIDRPSRTTVLLTCGDDLCKSMDEVLALTRLVHSRLALITVTP